MKRKIILLLTFVAFNFFSCQNEKVLEKFTTDLEVIVLDDDNKILPNVSVLLYRSEFDMLARSFPERELKTDAKGRVLFENLPTANFFIYSFFEKDDDYFDNSVVGHEIGAELLDGSLTRTKIYLKYARPAKPTQFSIDEIRLVKYQQILDNNRWLEIGLYKIPDFDPNEGASALIAPYLFSEKELWDERFFQAIEDSAFYYEEMPNVLLQSHQFNRFDGKELGVFGILDIAKEYTFMQHKFKNSFPFAATNNQQLVLTWAEYSRVANVASIFDYPYYTVLSGNENSGENIDNLQNNPVGFTLADGKKLGYPNVIRIEFDFPRKGAIDLRLNWY